MAWKTRTINHRDYGTITEDELVRRDIAGHDCREYTALLHTLRQLWGTPQPS
jgi:hypothetical protein